MSDRDFLRQMYNRRIKSVADLQTGEFSKARFLIVMNDSITAMGADYGPPDPPPSMETTHFTQLIALMDEAEVAIWAEDHINNTRWGKPAPYQILRIEPVTITTTVSIKVE